MLTLTRAACCAALSTSLLLSACASPGGGTPAQQNVLWQESEASVSRFKSRDPSMQRFFDNAAGYAVFPQVGKGGLWVGGAHAGKANVEVIKDLTKSLIQVGDEVTEDAG